MPDGNHLVLKMHMMQEVKKTYIYIITSGAICLHENNGQHAIKLNVFCSSAIKSALFLI